jgi:hypothetical protein
VEEFLLAIWDFIYTFVVTILQSKTFFVFKIFMAVYTTVLIVDVILLVYLGDMRKKMRELKKGASTIKTSKKSDVMKWQKIANRLLTDDEKQYRAAILEADQFVYEILEIQGYSGGNFAERISQIPPGSFSSLETIRVVHDLSRKIVLDEKLRITKEQAQNALNVYEKFLKETDVL